MSEKDSGFLSDSFLVVFRLLFLLLREEEQEGDDDDDDAEEVFRASRSCSLF
jgi:hypothetical protein